MPSKCTLKLPLRISELVLIVGLVFLVGLIRIYYGGSQGLMVVWKGDWTFRDTLVNLVSLQNMPREQLLKQHKSVFWQLEAMDLLEDDQDLQVIKSRRAFRSKRATQPVPGVQSSPRDP